SLRVWWVPHPALARSVSIIVLTLPMVSCAPADDPDARVERFQAALDALRAETEIPGATAAYSTPDGAVRGFATGLANVELDSPMEVESRMLAGSIGKTFVAATAIAASREGKLGLDDRLADWLGTEDWYARLPNGSTVTLRHLLTHSSGLLDHVYLDPFRAAMDRTRGDATASLSPRELIEFVLDAEPLFAVGEGYAYSDTGYILVGLVLERAVGKPYYDQVRERFLDRLELTRTRPSDRPELPGLAAGYLETKNRFGLPSRVVGDDGSMRYNPATEWTGGGLYSNPQDLVRWAKLLYEGRAIDGDYLDELLHSGYRGDDATAVYGLGAYQYQTSFGPAYGHGGWIPGYNSAMRYFPAERFALAIQINRSYDNDLPAIVDRLAAAYLGAALTPSDG
ncbi:MAG TPA: serine hydrolase domain-containing protein, partial [Thermoanaerobaculia bacterium]|nr:serine hydrolase domain-containing protein [Thermoanaerobaculia bacterium]